MTRTSTDSGRLGRAVSFLLEPIDAAWLAAFRVLFGLTLAFSMYRFIANDWIERFFVRPQFHFKYWGFGWVEPLSAPGMQALFVVLVLLGLAVALGLAFRLSALSFALGLSYVQLIDVSTYLNHYYLAALLAFLLAASPAGRSHSVDAWLRRRFLGLLPAPRAAPGVPGIARAWLWLFRFQIGLVYFFAGLAKAQSDWLVHAQPLRIWLGAVTDLPLIGPFVTLPFAPVLFAWCGFLFDTTIVFFLLWKRARPFAYAVVIVFHALTRLLFPIGMFPAIMVLSALVFFEAEWPRGLARKLGALFSRERAAGTASFATAESRAETQSAPARRWHRYALAFGAAYCLVQAALPLRYLAYGGNVLWHEQGMRFSWRVMLRAKGGSTTFLVKSPATGRRFFVAPRDYLTNMQENEMASQPDLIVQLAHHIRDDFRERGFGDVEVYAESRVSLNGRRSVRFLDPKVDLARRSEAIALAELVEPAPTTPPVHTRPVL